MNTAACTFSQNSSPSNPRPSQSYFEEIFIQNSGLCSWALSRLQLARQQTHRLNLLVIGPEGVGKRSLINTLFNQTIISTDAPPPPHHDNDDDETNEPLDFVIHQGECVEGEVKLLVQVVEVVGYERPSQFQDPATCCAILNYLRDRYGITSSPADPQKSPVSLKADDREGWIQAILYCLPPASSHHKFTCGELAFFKVIQDYAVVVPLICKADIYTTEELKNLKLLIRAQFEAANLEMLPSLAFSLLDGSPSTMFLIEERKKIEQHWPFAIIGATSHNNTERTRNYPWARIDVDNEEYADLHCLEILLISTFKCFLDKYVREELYERRRRPLLMKSAPNTAIDEQISPLEIVTAAIDIADAERKDIPSQEGPSPSGIIL